VSLTGRQVRYLRSRAPSLEPVLSVGRSGLTVPVIDAIDECFSRRELIKIRVREVAGADRRTFAREIAGATGAELVQVLGRTVVLYRAADPWKDQVERIELPG